MVQTGGLLAAILLGTPPIQVYTKDGDIATVGAAAVVWFLVFFCPFDLFYKLCRLSVMKVSNHYCMVYPLFTHIRMMRLYYSSLSPNWCVCVCEGIW